MNAGKEAAIPLSAIRYDVSQAYVWAVGANSSIVRVNVNVTPSPDVTKAYVTGIAPGDKIVTAGAASLKEGEKVNVLQQPSETNIGGLL